MFRWKDSLAVWHVGAVGLAPARREIRDCLGKCRLGKFGCGKCSFQIGLSTRPVAHVQRKSAGFGPRMAREWTQMANRYGCGKIVAGFA